MNAHNSEDYEDTTWVGEYPDTGTYVTSYSSRCWLVPSVQPHFDPAMRRVKAVLDAAFDAGSHARGAGEAWLPGVGHLLVYCALIYSRNGEANKVMHRRYVLDPQAVKREIENHTSK